MFGGIGGSRFEVRCSTFLFNWVTHMSSSCPIPIQQYPHVLMAHGGGGKLMHRLLEDVFGKAFSNPILDARHDSAQFTVPPGRLASRGAGQREQPDHRFL